MIKLKGILKENSALGILPSSKLMKMKWNPLTEPNGPLTEEYIEGMHDLDKGLALIEDSWLDWKKGPATEPSDIKPAQKELVNYIASWLKKKIK